MAHSALNRSLILGKMVTAMGETLQLEVMDVVAEARDVVLVEMRRQNGAPLPVFDPGAHLEVELPNGLVRHYSLANDSNERDRYLIGVGRTSGSRGGSLYIHQALRRGMQLTARVRNNFRLDSESQRFLFIAGGIGITPIMSMIRWCEVNGRQWRLVYACRSAQRAAFYETLRGFGERVHFHFDDDAGCVLDAGRWVSTVAEHEQVYCCGPEPLMASVKRQSAHLPAQNVRFEHFSAPAEDMQASSAPARSFKVTLRKSGKVFVVASDQNVLDALEDAGVSVPFACREGTCGTCETGVCEGEIDHRDHVLTEAERLSGKSMMVCVSRARSAELVLDL
jgi:vanillate O-demethylase ferredoxin subunit